MSTAVLARRRLPLLALAIVALLAGLTGALVLLGLPMPSETAQLAAIHGVLMTLGFLGTMIALERAVALGRRWGYVAPLGAGLGGVALMLGLPPVIGASLMVIGGAAFVAMYVAFDRIERSLHTSVQAVGAVAWLVAALLLVSGRPVSAVIPWLAAFLVLTIAGERLELSRLGGLSPKARLGFVVVAALFCGGVVVTLVEPDLGVRFGGAGLIGLAAWLARNDLARRTVRFPGVTRFIALCLLIGYAWLAVAGGCWLVFGGAGLTGAGQPYDAMLHTLFLGFVMSMVFGHAPIILPAVLRLPLPYQPRFYWHLALLHAGLLLRVVGGDVLGSQAAWQAGGILNVTALLLFVGSSAVAIVAATDRGRARGLPRRRASRGAELPHAFSGSSRET
ncbi:MAG TPA: hypothetical protein VNF73_02455 [Candidatus Saccharimonadales bacterium]|nr:hypothetical protein [Candidatus Saccharimonadales bacterium]